MSTRAVHVVVDSADPPAQARFWAQALDWVVAADDPDEAETWPAGFSYPSPEALSLVFVPVPERKSGKNRLHLDLASTSAQHQAELVDKVLGLGATHADIGQGDVPWVVLADPEGNEFCVLEPRDAYAGTGPIAAVVTDIADPVAGAAFWALAAGWEPQVSKPQFASLRSPAGTGPFLEFMRSSDPKRVKNRLHVDVAPPAGGDTRAEAARLIAAGARPIDVGQGEQTFIVLADPQDNEFCVLSPR
jgi:predicted enzyme related to lactoylglutathione lyase